MTTSKSAQRAPIFSLQFVLGDGVVQINGAALKVFAMGALAEDTKVPDGETRTVSLKYENWNFEVEAKYGRSLLLQNAPVVQIRQVS